MSHWRMATDFIRRNLVDKTWAYELALNTTFEQHVLKSMDALDKCRQNANGTQFVEKCITRDNYVLGIGMYDDQVNMYLQSFPKSYFCIVENSHLEADTGALMARVSNFIGLRQIDWSKFDVHANTRDRVSPYGAAPALTVDPAVKLKMEDFFKRHGQYYYEQARKLGYWGCQTKMGM